jgi:hypothetical protein
MTPDAKTDNDSTLERLVILLAFFCLGVAVSCLFCIYLYSNSIGYFQ